MQVKIDDKSLTIKDFYSIFKEEKPISIEQETRARIQKSRKFLKRKIENAQSPIYGINTGFGQLCDQKISDSDLEKLQINLVRSHACGIGQPVPDHISRIMLLLKIRSFTTGYSAVSEELFDRLLELYNSGASPVIFEKGSLGASGDLVPLAHLTLPILGEGHINHKGKTITGSEYLKEAGDKPFILKAKEGLAMLNGTQFMLALGLDSIDRSRKIMDAAIWICALSIDAFDSRIDFLHPEIHNVRPHKGQIEVAKRMKALLENSKIATSPKKQVQDPYSVRCLPQVLGASLDTINYAASVLETELNSITDNPLVFENQDAVISGGNFHGQPLALVLDFLGIAMAEVANICERLLYKLLSGERGLPVFLTKNPGLESGFMIPQYSAASLVSENKQLATPASVDSIVSSNGQEDHVSMGANAGLKCTRILDNVEAVLGILLLAGAQALEFRRPLESSLEIESLFSDFRKKVDFRVSDSYFKPDIDMALEFVKSYPFEK